MEREIDPNWKDEDVLGNNAAVTCPKCGKVYIVSAFASPLGARRCPRCQQSIARFRNGVATLEWPEAGTLDSLLASKAGG